MRVLLSIPSLEPGGAERQFAELARGLAGRGHAVLAVTLGRGGPLAGALGGARLAELGKRSRLDNLRVARDLGRLLGEFRPDAHYAFLTAPNVLGALLTYAHSRIPLVMGVRATPVRHAAYRHGIAGRGIEAAERLLSRRAALVIANSGPGRDACLERGFDPARVVVVPNGIDTARLAPDRALGAELRAAWGAAEGPPLVGLVARLDPMKDHAGFLRAAALLAQTRPDARFVCVGGGPEAYATELRALADGLGLGQRLTWAGVRHDMERVYNALDLLCLASAWGEGFPNVLGEAMACGVPCVATDVGDAAMVLGETGVVVPHGRPDTLAAGLAAQLDRLAREGQTLRAACRERIAGRFSVERMVAATEELLLGLARRRA
jgi:glycosyltransferase involved in cell wall biosynthesis